MYKHLVLWKLKEHADGLDKTGLALKVKEKLDSLPAVINEISGYEV